MDLTYFIQHKNDPGMEIANKVGLYCVSQSHIPPQFQAFRCGLAGKNAGDADPAFRSKEGTFQARMANYLSGGWLPTDGKIWAALKVKRRKVSGKSERVVDVNSNKEGFRRMDDAKMLIEIMEQQYHKLLVINGMKRLAMPGTEERKKKGEFFQGDLSLAIKALKALGGDLYLFNGNEPPTVQTYKGTWKAPQTEQIPLRKSARFTATNSNLNGLQQDDGNAKRAVAKLNSFHMQTRSSSRTKDDNLEKEKPQKEKPQPRRSQRIASVKAD